MYGPKNIYLFHGYSHYSSQAWMNSVQVNNHGKRTVVFKDGQSITWNFCHELYSNTFMSTPKHESLGSITFVDAGNGFECTITFNNIKKK